MPTMPTGYISPMWLTVGETDVPQMSVNVTLPNELRSIVLSGVLNPYSDTMLTGSGHQLIIHPSDTNRQPRWNIILDGETLTLTSGGSADMSEAELRADRRTMYGTSGEYFIGGNLYAPTQTLTLALFNREGISVGSVSQSVVFDPLPDRYRTTRRYATLYIGGSDIQNATEGVYYAQVAVGGNTYITEPWRWKDDLSGFVRVKYRRSRPILTAANYITYTSNGEAAYAELYLPGILMKPPYNYEVEMDSRDGYNFVKKQVSYISDQVTVLCSGYFAEALRMLWHCDEREYEVEGEMTEIDYMESPEPNWVDRHLCEVSVIFRSGTVVQTNGEP